MAPPRSTPKQSDTRTPKLVKTPTSAAATTGKVRKIARKSNALVALQSFKSPRARRKSAGGGSILYHTVAGSFSHGLLSIDPRRYEEMMRERELFPNSKAWAPAEDRLFQILYMRQYRPLMLSHWAIDFRGIPVPDILFAKTRPHEAVIQSRSGNDFRATKALIHLIDLTSTVRTLSQTSQDEKVPGAIKRELDIYLKWAERDGGLHANDLPNIVCEIVDTSLPGNTIMSQIQDKLRSLARKHRKAWGDVAPYMSSSPSTILRVKTEEFDANSTDSPFGVVAAPAGPPVLYGLFVVHATLMILTLDAAKSEAEAMASYQVEVNFNKSHQGVWNAITVGIVACLARDDRIKQLRYLQRQNADDPDA